MKNWYVYGMLKFVLTSFISYIIKYIGQGCCRTIKIVAIYWLCIKGTERGGYTGEARKSICLL